MNTDEAKIVQVTEQRRALEQIAGLVGIGLRALSQRMITAIALVLESVMFGWAMLEGGWDRLAIAATFATAAWALVHLRRRGANDET